MASEQNTGPMERAQAEEEIFEGFCLMQVYIHCRGKHTFITPYRHCFLIQLSLHTLKVGETMPNSSTVSNGFWYDWKEATRIIGTAADETSV